jgi:hemerythrin superfamily protein
MSDRPETTSENDVVQLLLHQHEEIRRLFAEVTNAASADRAEAFDRLRRLLAVHETAEELIVHPDARSLIADGDLVVDACLAEELAAKQMLVELENLGTEAAGFLPKLEELRIAVEDHAKHEEQEEFPGLRSAHSDSRLKTMAKAVKAAEALAPTHPHPGVESATANLLVGPYATMLDRAYDVISQAIGHPVGDSRQSDGR